MQTDARASSPPASLSHEQRASYLFLTVVTSVALAADLATKAWAKVRLSGFDAQKLGPKEIEVIKDHFSFIYALNPGGAWSFLRGLPDSLRRPFFLFVSASAIVFIVSIYKRVPRGHTAMRWGLPLALGGAMGNLVDRIRYGSVIDFIDVYLTRGPKEHHWPTFNVADIAIVIGVGLMVIDMLIPARKPKAEQLARPLLAEGVATEPAAPTSMMEAAPDTSTPATLPATQEALAHAEALALAELLTPAAGDGAPKDGEGGRAEGEGEGQEPAAKALP